jgi:DNA-binding NtrC family response regulator
MSTKKMIFVVDDDLDTQEMILQFLEAKNYNTKGFLSAELALDEIAMDPKACDVLLTDLILPQMSGLTLMEELLAQGFSSPIILMTGHKTAEMAVAAVAAGAYDFIAKPIRFTQLQVSIERAVYLNKVRDENTTLRSVVESKDGSGIESLIGKSPLFLKAVDLVKRVAASNSSVLITGESGSGKEVFARAIHQLGKGSRKPFVAINCSSIPENLLESELFGHAKGAFTGAIDKKIGLFEEAEGGTLFLDEIGDLSLALQAKVLRAIQERKIKRVGENQMRSIDIRIISATHKNFKIEIANKTFREDLFYRLNVIPIHVPALRARTEDILLLAEFFLKKFAILNKSSIRGFTADAKEVLLKNPWPGNVRELQNCIERAVVLSQGSLVTTQDLEHLSTPQDLEEVTQERKVDGFYLPATPILPLEEVVRLYMTHALESNLGAKEQTAKALGINRKTLYLHLKQSRNEKRPLAIAKGPYAVRQLGFDY